MGEVRSIGLSKSALMSIESKHGVDEPGYEPPEAPEDEDYEEYEEPRRWYQFTSFRVAVGLILIVLFLAWHAGTFDHLLYNVGLNAKPCARNGFGATFCGEELTEYNERLENAKREGNEASEKIERESQETEAKAQRELKEDEESGG